MQTKSKLGSLVLASYFGIAWLVIQCSPATAQTLKPVEACYPVGTRFITTTGSDEIEALPDRAKVIMAVRTWDKNVNTASAQNNTSMDAIIKLTAKYHIGSNDIQTGRLNIQPTYPTKRSENGKMIPEGYQVYKSLTVIVKNLDDVPGLLEDALDAGANSIESVTFDLDKAQLHKYENEAATKAVQAAEQKAEAIAAPSKAKLGKALLIREEGTGVTNLNGAVLRDQVFSRALVVPKAMSPVEPGQLKVNASVTVTYELVD